MSGEASYLRYEAAQAGPRGAHAGVFALANGIARSGQLSDAEWAWWRASNEWYERELPNPSLANPSLFDRSKHPVVSCWFRSTAEELLERVAGYLCLLDRHGIAWRLRRSCDPGRLLYEDEFQVVAAPYGIGRRPEADSSDRKPPHFDQVAKHHGTVAAGVLILDRPADAGVTTACGVISSG